MLTAVFLSCRKNIHLSNWEAVLGLHSQDSVDVLPSQTRKVDHIIMNKHYNRRTKDADIAMMHLQTNVNFTGVQSNTPLLYIAWEFDLMSDWH